LAIKNLLPSGQNKFNDSDSESEEIEDHFKELNKKIKRKQSLEILESTIQKKY
jgi:hypothetical protein